MYHFYPRWGQTLSVTEIPQKTQAAEFVTLVIYVKLPDFNSIYSKKK